MNVIFRRMIGGKYKEFASDLSMAALPRIGDKIIINLLENGTKEFYVRGVAFQCTLVQTGKHAETKDDYYHCVSYQNPIIVDVDIMPPAKLLNA